MSGHYLCARGEMLPQAKLTEADVREIRRLHRRGVRGKALADRFGISRVNAWMVASYTTWRHVRDEA